MEFYNSNSGVTAFHAFSVVFVFVVIVVVAVVIVFYDVKRGLFPLGCISWLAFCESDALLGLDETFQGWDVRSVTLTFDEKLQVFVYTSLYTHILRGRSNNTWHFPV